MKKKGTKIISKTGKTLVQEFSETEKRICAVMQNNPLYLELEMESNESRTEDNEFTENVQPTSPYYIEFLEYTDNPLTDHKQESLPSSSPKLIPAFKKRRKRLRSSENSTDEEFQKRQNSMFTDTSKRRVTNHDEYQRLQHHQLLEIKRLELETLRETNLHEREKERAQIDRDGIRVQQQLLAYLEDIKPALLKYLNK